MTQQRNAIAGRTPGPAHRRTQGRAHRQAALAAVAVGLLAATAACGTRLPATSFGAAAQQGTATAGPGAAGTDALGQPAVVASGDPGSVVAGAVGSGAASGGNPAAGTTGTAGSTGTTTTTSGGGTGSTTTTGTTSSGSSTSKSTGSTAAGKTGTSTTTSKAGTATAANTASDVGVTPTTISVCNVVTKGGPFGPTQFTQGTIGAAAFFAQLNASGGINGRAVRFKSEPDDGTTSGNSNSIHTCIDTDKAFAFVANNIYQYGGVSYEDSKDIPDIGGQPISTAYYYYPHLYSILGVYVPRNHQLGYNGTIYNTAEQGEFFKQRVGTQHVGVVYYDQSSSQYGSNEISAGFTHAGVKATTYSVTLGLPNFGSVVSQMQADGVDTVADALDQNGNQKLCQAIEQNATFVKQLKAKVSTVANWTQSYGQQFANTPNCLAKSYVDDEAWDFADSAHNPEVARFDANIKKYFPSSANAETQWMLEGWIAANWFTHAAKSCGANLTRTCFEGFMNHDQPFDGDGALNPLTSFKVRPPSYYDQPTNQCVSVAQWSTAAGTWVDRGDFKNACFASPGFPYQATEPS